MKAEKYCGLCGQKIEIEYEPRQPVRVICGLRYLPTAHACSTIWQQLVLTHAKSTVAT